MGPTDENLLRHRILGVIALCLVTIPAWGQLSPVDDASAVPMPEEIDPAEMSGWILVEVAVLVDDRDETLFSEQWPARPNVRYPGNYRRLLDNDVIERLQERFPSADVAETNDGHIKVTLEDPTRVLSKAIIDEQMRLQREAEELALLEELAESGQEMTGMPDDLPDEDELKSPAVDPAPLVPLDRLNKDSDARALQPPIDRLYDPAEILPQSSEASTPMPDASPLVMQRLDEDLAEGSGLESIAPPPSLPTPFVSRPLTLMAAGVRSLQRKPGNALESAAAWLQGPNAGSRPIVFDRSGETSPRAPLQGFVQLRPTSPLKIGINFWRATDGKYMPENFNIDPPEKAAPGISFGESTSGNSISEDVAKNFQRKLSALEDFIASEQPLSDFSYTAIDEIDSMVDTSNHSSDDPEDWPWGHLIHIADTRALEAGVVRYFDHPVIKVLVTYQELTWGEVYAQGHEEWLARQAKILEAQEEIEGETEKSQQP